MCIFLEILFLNDAIMHKGHCLLNNSRWAQYHVGVRYIYIYDGYVLNVFYKRITITGALKEIYFDDTTKIYDL